MTQTSLISGGHASEADALGTLLERSPAPAPVLPSLTLPAAPATVDAGSARSSTPLRLSDGERAALWEELQPLVRRLVRQYGEDPELRQDLEGEIYCRFFQLVAAYDPSRQIPLRAYLVKTLPPSIYSYARSQWRCKRRETFLDGEVEESAEAPAEDPTRLWDEQLALAGQLQELPKAIAALPLRQRQIVIWRYYEGRSFEEIAETLAVQPATVRSLLRHGLNSLRRLMDPTAAGRK